MLGSVKAEEDLVRLSARRSIITKALLAVILGLLSIEPPYHDVNCAAALT